MRTAFPPRGPRSCLLKVPVTIAERKEVEALALAYGCSTIDAVKTALKLEAARMRDHVPAVVREADDGK